MSERQQSQEGEDFAWTRLQPGEELLRDEAGSIFLVQVKSESDVGRELLMAPIRVLRDRIPELRSVLREDAQASVLRVNAETEVFRVHRSEIWVVYPPPRESGAQRAVGIQYKYEAVEGED